MASGDLILSIESTVTHPGTDDKMDLGESALEFKDLYIDGIAYIDTIDSTILGTASTSTITCTGRLILRTLVSDPQDFTPASRPAGSVGELAYYNGRLYYCTATTPNWELIQQEIVPSPSPSVSPSPSYSPSKSPSISPSPSYSPSRSESLSPSLSPSKSPSASESASPSLSPSVSGSVSPSMSPSISESISPSMSPSASPSPSTPP